jgi:hypothetical protein
MRTTSRRAVPFAIQRGAQPVYAWAQFLIYANIKTSFEYQIQPLQIVYSPGTNIPLTNALCMNSAVAGLEFVY